MNCNLQTTKYLGQMMPMHCGINVQLSLTRTTILQFSVSKKWRKMSQLIQTIFGFLLQWPFWTKNFTPCISYDSGKCLSQWGEILNLKIKFLLVVCCLVKQKKRRKVSRSFHFRPNMQFVIGCCAVQVTHVCNALNLWRYF